MARSEWQDAEHAEGLMLDQVGRVVEGVFSNLFLVRDGVLLTADLKPLRRGRRDACRIIVSGRVAGTSPRKSPTSACDSAAIGR